MSLKNYWIYFECLLRFKLKINTYDWPSIIQTFFLELSSLIAIVFEVNEPFDLLHCFIITIIVVGDGFYRSIERFNWNNKKKYSLLLY